MSHYSRIHHLKGSVMAHALATHLGCAHTGYALAKWAETLWRERHPGGPERDRPISKWSAYFAGSLSREVKLLLDEVPDLKPIWSNPLWQVLGCLWDERRSTDDLVLQLRLDNGWSLPMHDATCMRRVCTCPDWQNLGFALAVLGSKSYQQGARRKWLRDHFAPFFLLISLAQPCCFIREDLYQLLSELSERSSLSAIEAWPADWSSFQAECQIVQNLGEALQSRGWIRLWDLYACTFLYLCWLSCSRTWIMPDDLDSQKSLFASLARRTVKALQRHQHCNCVFLSAQYEGIPSGVPT